MTSSREEDERVMEILAAAHRKPAGEREAYLQSACAGDEDLRREVVDALSWEERMGGFLQQPVAVIADGNPDSAHTAAVQFAPGLEIGQYRIESKLGEGGMSSVWLALDTRLGRRVAIKFLSDDLADAEARRRFQREAQMASSLNHPHIVTVYDIGEFEGRQYLVTEYVDGGTLKDWIKEKRRTAKEVAELLTGVADGLAAAHQAGILHRDIKPQNILVARNGYAKLADFGLAKLAENGRIDLAARLPEGATRPGLILGTIAYMSPEQASGQPLDSRSDIFSFGVVLYEMLSGRRPFGGVTDLEVLKTIIHGDLPPLSEAVPETYRNIVEKALEKSPAERYQSMREMVVDLRRSQRSQRLPAPGVEEAIAHVEPEPGSPSLLPAQPRPRWRRALPWAAAFLTGAILAAIGFVFFAIRRPHLPAMHFRAVTNFSGVQSHPALSPDGRSVAFVSNRDGHYNIYVGLLNGANPVKLTDDPNLKNSPCWSPDGTEIAYARLNDSGIWDIWKVPALGGTSQRFVLNASDPAWSRDGRRLTYRKSSTGAIWISDASGQNGRELTRAQNELFGNSGPRFSPDGSEIAYAASLGGPSGELEIVEVDSGKVRRLTHDAALVLSPAWSADGRFIYFASSRGGTLNVWKIAEKGGEPEQITTGQGDDIQLDISRDGKRIVFSTFRSNVNLAELDLSPGGQKNTRLLVADLARSQSGPVYSPDGKHLAYFSILKGIEKEGIWLANSDGSDPVPLVQDGFPNIFPRWTPDSAYLIYIVFRGGNQFRRVSISGGAPEILRRDISDYLPDIDSDGQLLFRGPHGEVQISNSQTVQTLFTLPSDMNSTLFRWSPDHRSIAFEVNPTQEGDPRAGVWLFEGNGPPRQIYRGWVAWYAWGPGNEIYLVQAKPDLEGVLWKIDRSGRDLTRIPVSIPLPFDYWYVVPMTQFDISPDGRHLALITQQVLQANIGMLENVE